MIELCALSGISDFSFSVRFWGNASSPFNVSTVLCWTRMALIFTLHNPKSFWPINLLMSNFEEPLSFSHTAPLCYEINQWNTTILDNYQRMIKYEFRYALNIATTFKNCAKKKLAKQPNKKQFTLFNQTWYISTKRRPFYWSIKWNCLNRSHIHVSTTWFLSLPQPES